MVLGKFPHFLARGTDHQPRHHDNNAKKLANATTPSLTLTLTLTLPLPTPKLMSLTIFNDYVVVARENIRDGTSSGKCADTALVYGDSTEVSCRHHQRHYISTSNNKLIIKHTGTTRLTQGTRSATTSNAH